MGQPWRPRELSPIFVVHTRGSFFKAPMKWVGTGLRRARQQHTVVHNNGDSDDNRVVEEENHRRG
ncbi:hypothetical protein DEO72_LG1g1710 [Vigna unguiculata]|uniref:Uncharacterized protein n=1 Tax=Vigna unguiculata TaxID=3917 RepID=A0A4D6KU92_VIGUN|nr:hypothetical protein DEO72_LG1g1710 [Vigna unguiculata]